MANKKIVIEISGGCKSLMEAFIREGLATAYVGTPSYSSAIFTTPLLPSGYYMRFRNENNDTSTLAVEIGTWDGSLFTIVTAICVYNTSNSGARTYTHICLDATKTWVLICDNGYSTHAIYIGQMDSGVKVAFNLSNTAAIASTALNLDTLTALGDLWLFGGTATLNGNYLEQPLYVLDAGGEFMMNGSSIATVKGIKNIAIAFDSDIPMTQRGGGFLFGGAYLNPTTTQKTYLKVDMTI